RARDYLHKTGRFIVIGGIVSPVHDSYGKQGLVSSRHRLVMCQLAVQNSDWIRVDPWECYQDTWQTTCSVLEHHRDLMKRVTGCILSNVNTPSMTPVIGQPQNETSQPIYQNSNVPTKPTAAKILGKVGESLSRICCVRPPVERFTFVDENANLGTVMRYEEIELRILLLCGSDLLESFCIPGLWNEADVSSKVMACAQLAEKADCSASNFSPTWLLLTLSDPTFREPGKRAPEHISFYHLVFQVVLAGHRPVLSDHEPEALNLPMMAQEGEEENQNPQEQTKREATSSDRESKVQFPGPAFGVWDQPLEFGIFAMPHPDTSTKAHIQAWTGVYGKSRPKPKGFPTLGGTESAPSHFLSPSPPLPPLGAFDQKIKRYDQSCASPQNTHTQTPSGMKIKPMSSRLAKRAEKVCILWAKPLQRCHLDVETSRGLGYACWATEEGTYQMEVIVGDFGIVVVPRDAADTDRIMNHSSILRKYKNNIMVVKDDINHPMSVISSTKSSSLGPDIPKTIMRIENGEQPDQGWSKTVQKPNCMTRPLLYLVVHTPSRACEKGLREGQLLLYQGFNRKEKKGSIIRLALQHGDGHVVDYLSQPVIDYILKSQLYINTSG
ncbi:hypothetical protein E2I00_009193, partial [Balaenoptera physalus]